MILKKRQADFRLPLDKYLLVCYNNTVHSRGVAQLVARDVWDVDAAGSNPVTPTISSVHNDFQLWTLIHFASYFLYGA